LNKGDPKVADNAETIILEINLQNNNIISLTSIPGHFETLCVSKKDIFYYKDESIYKTCKIFMKKKTPLSQLQQAFSEINTFFENKTSQILKINRKDIQFVVSRDAQELFLSEDNYLYKYCLTNSQKRSKFEGHKFKVDKFYLDDKKKLLYRYHNNQIF
jgi:hypothetical protein